MEIEIPVWLYEMLLLEASETDSAAGAPQAIEEIVESAFRKFMKRNDENVNQ